MCGRVRAYAPLAPPHIAEDHGHSTAQQSWAARKDVKHSAADDQLDQRVSGTTAAVPTSRCRAALYRSRAAIYEYPAHVPSVIQVRYRSLLEGACGTLHQKYGKRPRQEEEEEPCPWRGGCEDSPTYRAQCKQAGAPCREEGSGGPRLQCRGPTTYKQVESLFWSTS